MKKIVINNYSLLLIIFLVSNILVGAQTNLTSELTAEYGPPSEANVWEKFTIPLTAVSFNTDETTFASVMSNINSFWIKTEMHTGDDIGGIDDVMIGSYYFSNFNTSSDGWSSGGDGTMEWIPSDGVDGGFLQISDWATGEYHWLISPSSWSGDWSDIIGQNIEFWFKTDKPSYSAEVKLTSDTILRLVMNAPVSYVLPNDSSLIQIEIIPASQTDLTITFSTSDKQCIAVRESVTIDPDNDVVYIYAVAATGATEGCKSVIDASAPGYLPSRVTLRVEDHSGLIDPALSKHTVIFPNPFSTSTTIEYELNHPETIKITFYNQFGKQVDMIEENQLTGLQKLVWTPEKLPDGIYYFRLRVGEQVVTGKMVKIK